MDLAEKMFRFIVLYDGVSHSKPSMVYGTMAFQLKKSSTKITIKSGFDRHNFSKLIRPRRNVGE